MRECINTYDFLGHPVQVVTDFAGEEQPTR